ADVGHDPFVASLDEPIVVELGGVGLDAFELAFDHREQGAQRLTLVGVADAVQGGQQLVQPLRHQQAHGPISVSAIAAGLINSSSAGVVVRDTASQCAPNAGTAVDAVSAGTGSSV